MHRVKDTSAQDTNPPGQTVVNDLCAQMTFKIVTGAINMERFIEFLELLQENLSHHR
jgi:hypothetical protein